jgi:hypothetical protein
MEKVVSSRCSTLCSAPVLNVPVRSTTELKYHTYSYNTVLSTYELAVLFLVSTLFSLDPFGTLPSLLPFLVPLEKKIIDHVCKSQDDF